MSRPIIHHRSSDFRGIFERCLERLGQVYRTDGDVLVYTASGTGGMESAVSNLTRPGDRVVVVSAGHFGERWSAMTRNFGCEVDELRYEWGESPPAEDLARRLASSAAPKSSSPRTRDLHRRRRRHPGTGGGGEGGRRAGVVDAVSSLGAVPLETDAWGLDAVVSGSQKALMSPLGLATVSVSLSLGRRGARCTVAVLLRLGPDARAAGGLRPRLHAGRLDRRRPRDRARPSPRRRAGASLRAPYPTGPSLPRRREGDGPRALLAGRRPVGGRHRRLRAGRDRLRRARPDASRPAWIVLAPGQGPLKGKIFRIGHIGYYDVFDITTALAGVELSSRSWAPTSSAGAAVTAALEAFEHTRVSDRPRVLVREPIAEAGIQLCGSGSTSTSTERRCSRSGSATTTRSSSARRRSSPRS